VNTYGLKGKSVDKLLSLKKLADVSKEQYLNSMRQFLVYSNQTPDELVRESKKRPKAFTNQFVTFIDKKAKETSPSTAALIRNSLKKFLDTNSVTGIDWPYIDDCIPEKKRYGSDRAPTVDEIRRMVNAADLRLKCIILFLSSSGARIGAIPSLRWGDVAEVKTQGLQLAKVTIYRGEKEQYDTFITPEAFEHLLEYKRYRENIGEKVTPQSPVFVTALNVDDFKPERIRPLASDTVKLLLGRLMKQLGFRQVLSEGKNARRFEFKTAHGLRKFFKTKTENAGVNRLDIEMMMGHNIGVQASYNKPSESEMAKEYAKAINELTIINRQTPSEDASLVTLRTMVESGQLDLSKESVLEYLGEKLKIKIPMIMEKQHRARLPKDSLGFGQPVELPPMPPRMDVEKLREQIYLVLGIEKKFRKINSDPQILIEEKELESYLAKGWEFVSTLPSKKILIRHA
jgi:integrase